MITRRYVRSGGFLLLTVLLGVLVMPTRSALAGGSKVNSDAVAEWQEAAFNYEYAAEAQEAAADSTMSQARTLRSVPDEDTVKSRRGKIQACNLDVRAADLLVASSANLDNAARTWRQAATAAGRDSESHSYFIATSDSCAGKATLLLRRAADLCEQAAAGLSAENELLSQAAANQKAAGIRERLATRQP